MFGVKEQRLGPGYMLPTAPLTIALAVPPVISRLAAIYSMCCAVRRVIVESIKSE